ncbi:YARHG domain-containing protein [Ancylobacter terrae]|uniref:YARHG domain-containing protein n=1 Tax=Ancylobacter sp. sgz301288 TaxID=3342077 RepID=UPI00385E5C59
MTDPQEHSTRPFGTWRSFAEMLDELALVKGLHTHKQLATAIKDATKQTVLEKNIGNWRRGDNLPSPAFLKPLADTLGVTGNAKLEPVWNRLYAEASAARKGQAVPMVQTDPPPPETSPLVEPVPVPSRRHGRVTIAAGMLAVATVVVVVAGAFRVLPIPALQAESGPVYRDYMPPDELRLTSAGFVLSDSASRALTVDDLKPLSGWELYVARNEIYARHGRRFLRTYSVCLQNHFNAWAKGSQNPKGWYVPVSGEVRPSEIELANADFIRAYECGERGGQYLCNGEVWQCGKKRPE